jgi:adenine-specific DNA glycosylase
LPRDCCDGSNITIGIYHGARSQALKILIAEKLLQQTAASHVLSVYGKFFERYPTVQALADTEQQEIEEIIRPLGLWRTAQGI